MSRYRHYTAEQYRQYMRRFFEMRRVQAPRRIGYRAEHAVIGDSDFRALRESMLFELMLKLVGQKWYLIDVVAKGPRHLEKRSSSLCLTPHDTIRVGIRPCETLRELAREYEDFLGEFGRCLSPGQSLAAPLGSRQRSGASAAVSIEYSSIEDFDRKFRTARYLFDAWTALFGASPVDRAAPDRHAAGLPEGFFPERVFPEGARDFESYVDALLVSRPCQFVVNGRMVSTGDATLEQLLTEQRLGPEHLLDLLERFGDACGGPTGERSCGVFRGGVRYTGRLEITLPVAVLPAHRYAVPAVIGEILYRPALLEHYHVMAERSAGLLRCEAGPAFLLELLDAVGDARTVDPDGVSRGALEDLRRVLKDRGSVSAHLAHTKRASREAYRARVSENPELRPDYDFERYDLTVDEPRWNSPRIRRAERIKEALPVNWAAQEDREADFERIDALVKSSAAYYKGEIVQHLYIPMLYNDADIRCFERLLDQMHRLCEKMIFLYKNVPQVRELYGFDPRIERLILLPQQLEPAVPMGRFDIFYYGRGEFTFCELNADGSSGMNEEAELDRCLIRSDLMRSVAARRRVWIEPFELFSSWVTRIRPIYDDYIGYKDFLPFEERLFVAIVDFVDRGTTVEFERFRREFVAQGYDCEIVDPRDIRLRDGFMTVNGRRIDVVYRRLVTADLLERIDEIPDFVAGIGQNTCVIGQIHTQVVHSKRFFEMLHHPELQDCWTDDERAWIARHIPHTVYLTAERAHDPRVVGNKDGYIIKPVDSYASQGVAAGCSMTDAEWKKLLAERADAGFILQEYARQPVQINVDPKTRQLEEYNTITGLFTYARKLAGIYVRAGKKDIISGLHDACTLATYRLITR